MDKIQDDFKVFKRNDIYWKEQILYRNMVALESIAQSLVKLSYCMEVQTGLRPDAIKEEEWLKKIQ